MEGLGPDMKTAQMRQLTMSSPAFLRFDLAGCVSESLTASQRTSYNFQSASVIGGELL